MLRKISTSIRIAAHLVAGTAVHFLMLILEDVTAWMIRRTVSVQRLNNSYVEYWKKIYKVSTPKSKLDSTKGTTSLESHE